MNLRELNGNGTHLWVFFTTAITALIITGSTWFLIEQVNGYRRRGNDRVQPEHVSGNAVFANAPAMTTEADFT